MVRLTPPAPGAVPTQQPAASAAPVPTPLPVLSPTAAASPTVQRTPQRTPHPPAPLPISPTAAAPPTVQRTPQQEPPPPYSPHPPVTAPNEPPPAYTPVDFDARALTGAQVDELTHRLIGPLTRLLRTELRLDRERIGRLRDSRH
ncbi:extensin [Streptomyces purpureus]|uniref:extensin n=1 Tax=Streptomyces purpureus TaxID=1951 RepID=UPI0037B30DE0